jgi:hypothetical protein
LLLMAVVEVVGLDMCHNDHHRQQQQQQPSHSIPAIEPAWPSAARAPPACSILCLMAIDEFQPPPW